MITDPSLYIPILIFGAFCAAFVIGAVGFADALILNAVWLHIMTPTSAIPLVVSCGVLMHLIPLYKLRKTLDFSGLPPFLLCGIFGVPVGVWVLNFSNPDVFKGVIGGLLIVYGAWMLVRPHTAIGDVGGRPADSMIGLGGGFLGGFAGLSGILPTIWVGLRGWPGIRQRGVYQPFVLIMHVLGIATFAASGAMTAQTFIDLSWCIPFIIAGSWLGVRVYAHVNDRILRKIILSLILVSGITLLI